MKAGTAKVGVTPTGSHVGANGRKPDPPVVYHPMHARCLSLNDGARRMVFVTYDFNCLEVATPILKERAGARTRNPFALSDLPRHPLMPV